jgi:hypothetical protein
MNKFETVNSFLARFATLGRLSELRRMPIYDHSELTNEVFLTLTREVIANFRSIENRDILHRFFNICIQYLYRDLRSMDSVSLLIENSIALPEVFGVDGCNALGALVLLAPELPPEFIDRIIGLCNHALKVPILAQNARLFLQATNE